MTPEQRNFQHAFSVAFGIGDLIVDVQDAAEEAINYIDDLDEGGFKFPIQRRTLTKQLKILNEILTMSEKAWNLHKKAGFKRIRNIR